MRSRCTAWDGALRVRAWCHTVTRMSTDRQQRSDVMDTLHVRLPAWLRAELERGAAANERTVSQEVRSRTAALRMSREN